MNKRFNLLALTLGFILMAPSILAAEDILIQVYVFRATWMGGQPGLKQVEILSAATNPEISSIKNAVSSSESELRANAVTALLKVHDLQTMDDLFSFVMPWDGKETGLNKPVIQKPDGYRFIFSPRWYLPQTVFLQAVLYLKEIKAPTPAGAATDKTLIKELENIVSSRQYEKRMEKILDEEIVLGFENPVIIGFPYQDRIYFMMIVVTGRPQPLQQVLPAYPEELRKQGIKGEAVFRVLIDDEGIVREVTVKKSLHPYLDNAGIQAIKKWTFEPVTRKGRSAAVSFNWTLDFDPEKWVGMEPAANSQEEVASSKPRAQELKKILGQCAEYSQKLADSALDFFCEETIKETNLEKYIHGSLKGGSSFRFKDLGGSGGMKAFAVFGPAILASDPYETKISRYVCDYQMFKKGNQIEERRVIVKENGRPTTDRNKMLDEKRFSVLKPLFAAANVLERDRQHLFVFRLLNDDKVRGKVTYVIEAVAKPGGTGSVQRTRIWVDKTNFQILQSEIQGMPAEGYEFIFKDAARFKIDPRFIMTSTYDVEKNGVLFPGRVYVLIEYPWNNLMQSKATKLETEISYDKYKFFTVETEHKIIK